MPTNQNFEIRRAAPVLLDHYNRACGAFPGGQVAEVDATQAAFTTIATVVTWMKTRGVLRPDKSEMTRCAEDLQDLYNACGITDANIAADNTIATHQARILALCNTAVNKSFQSGLHWSRC